MQTGMTENSRQYEATRCGRCGTTIVLSEGGYAQTGSEYLCGNCMDEDIQS